MTKTQKIMLALVLAVISIMPFYLMRLNRCLDGAKPEEPPYHVSEGYIAEGDVLGNVLVENGLSPTEAHAVTNTLQEVFNVRRCRPGDRWEIYRCERGEEFIEFRYYRGPIDYFVVTAEAAETGRTYMASALQVDTERILRGARGEIRSSLYESMSYVDVNAEVIVQFAEIFASKIDFFTDCRTGDGFSLLWESYVDAGGNVLRDSRIYAASYSAGGGKRYAFYFATDEGSGGYYDEKGESVESAFLRAPLNYRRISSHFTHRRFHPIHRVYRPHLGIDYAAPTGTPVSAIGDGTVTFAGWRRDGFGITVIIRHPNGYISWYGHLSSIARGVTSGTRVKKGQVIGYVGMTGTATGPHLDFRIQKDGKFINFLTLDLPPSYPLPEEYRERFQEHKEILKAKMEKLAYGETVFSPDMEGLWHE